MPVFKKLISDVAPTRRASQSEVCPDAQEQIDTLRLWLDKIKASATKQDKVEDNLIERMRLFLLKRQVDHCIDLVSKLCLLSGRSTTVESSLRNVHRNVHKLAHRLKLSQHLPPPVYMHGRFIEPPGKLRRFLSRVYKRYSQKTAIQTEEESKSNNHEQLLAIIRERKTPEKPNRALLYSHRDVFARLKNRRGSRIQIKSLRRVCKMSEVPEEDLIGQDEQSTTDLSTTCSSTFSFERCDSTRLVLSEQHSSQELLAVKESCCESEIAEEVILKVESIPDTLSDGNNADAPSGPVNPRPVRSPRATLPPLQISPRSTRSTVSGFLGLASPKTDVIQPICVSPVLPPLSPRSTGKLFTVKTLSASPTPETSEAGTEPVRSSIRDTSSYDLPTEMARGNDTMKEVISHLEITKNNTIGEVSSETGPLRVRSPRRSSLPPLKISPRSSGKPSIPVVNEVETDMTSKLESMIGLGVPYALPPIMVSKSFPNGKDVTSNSVRAEASSENGQKRVVGGAVAVSSSADTASRKSPVPISHSPVSVFASRMNTQKKSIFVRAWRCLRGVFCIKKVAPL